MHYVDIQSLIWQYFEIFNLNSYAFVCDTKTPTIYDCGGNIGLATAWFKTQYPKADIKIFEANPNVLDTLKTNLNEWHVHDAEIIEAALWDNNGEKNFDAVNSDAGRITDRVPGIKVKTIRLSDLINKPIDLLKIDIEGAEFRVINDLCQSGKIDIVKRIIGEIHLKSEDGMELGRLVKNLSSAGFNITFRHCISVPFLFGYQQATPFPGLSDGKCLIHFYAWKQ